MVHPPDQPHPPVFDRPGPGRVIVGLVAGSLLVGLLVAVFANRGRRPAPPPTNPCDSTDAHSKLDLQDPSACATCHAAIYEEWHSSQHRTSRSDPDLDRLALVIGGNPDAPECAGCHLPGPIAELPPGPDGDAAHPMPLTRGTRPDHGVDCASCHVRFGRIVGAGRSPPAARAGAGCDSAGDPLLASSDACASCHQSYRAGSKHAWDEWHADMASNPDAQSCADCHMPLANGGPAGGPGQHRSHIMPGGHHPAFVASALTARLIPRHSATGLAAVVVLTNTGTGHRFPTGYKIRRVAVIVSLFGPDGNLSARQSFDMQKPSRWGGSDGFQLRHGETRELTFEFGDDPLPTGTVLELDIRYRLWPTDEGVSIAHQRVPVGG